MSLEAPTHPPREQALAGRPRGARARSVAVAVVVAAIAAVSAGRFLAAGGPDRAAGPPPRTPAEATARLEADVAARPDDPALWRALSGAYLDRSVETQDPQYYALAENAIEEAGRLGPDDPQTLAAQARLANTLHDFTEGRRLALAALEAKPLDALALGMVVDAEIELGRYADAEAHLQTLLDRRPTTPALTRAAYVRELHGDLDGALLALRQADASARTDGSTQFDRAVLAAIRGEVLVNQGRFGDAADAFAESERHSPALPTAQLGLARVEAGRGELSAAADRLAALVAKAPLPAAVILLAEVQDALGRSGEAGASRDLVWAIARLQAAQGARLDLDLAVFEVDWGADPAAALARARAAYEARPSVYGADALAWALRRAGELPEAVRRAEEALRLGSIDPLVRYHAAAIFAEAGLAERAAAELTQVFALNPQFSLTHGPAAAALADQLGLRPSR